jgi:hypothetical protein
MTKRKEIKIINEKEANLTFIDAGSTDIKKESDGNDLNKKYSNTVKDMIKSRSVDSMKSKIRHKNRIGADKL